MKINWVVAKNAMANLARGAAAGVAALLLPPILVRHMSQLDYTLWVLVLQIAAYSSYLDFGLQTAIGRYVAFANEKKDPELRDGIFSTAFLGLSLAGAICIFLLLAIAAALHNLFPQIPAAAVPNMRWALVIVGSSIAFGLPASAWSGAFVGLQRNEMPAIVTGLAKIISALAVAVAATRGHSIILMAALLAAFNLGSYFALFALLRKVAPNITFRLSHVRLSSVKDLAGYCSSLTIWSFAMMLISGVDLLLVGRFQVDALAPYAVAASLITFIAGAQTAIFSALVPHAAVVHARNDPAALGRMVITSTRLGVLFLVLTGLPLLLYANPLLTAWVGAHYASSARALLLILLGANMIRLTGLPYSVVLIGTGQQRLITVSPLAEGLTNLIASIVLGMRFGAIGVAWGTFIGSIVGVSGNLFYNIPRTNSEVRIGVSEYVVKGICMPAAILPLVFALHRLTSLGPLLVSAVLSIIAIVATGSMFLNRRAMKNPIPGLKQSSLRKEVHAETKPS